MRDREQQHGRGAHRGDQAGAPAEPEMFLADQHYAQNPGETARAGNPFFQMTGPFEAQPREGAQGSN